MILSPYMLSALLWVAMAGNPFYYLFSSGPSGQGFYLLSKFIAFLGFVGLSVQMIMGLSNRSVIHPDFKRIHLLNGLLAFSFVMLHILLFIIATTIRSGHSTLHLLVPNFQAWYQTMVSIGVIGFYVLVLAVLVRSKWITRKKPQLVKWVHRFNFLAFALVIVHSLAIGSETRYLASMALYLFVVMLVFFFLVRKVFPPRLGRTAAL